MHLSAEQREGMSIKTDVSERPVIAYLEASAKLRGEVTMPILPAMLCVGVLVVSVPAVPWRVVGEGPAGRRLSAAHHAVRETTLLVFRDHFDLISAARHIVDGEGLAHPEDRIVQ